MSWMGGFKELFTQRDTRAEQEALAAALTETLQRSVDSATRFDALLFQVLKEHHRETASSRHRALLFHLNERLLKDLTTLY